MSPQQTVRAKCLVDSGFSNMLHGKKQKPGHTGNQQKAFGFNKQKTHFQAIIVKSHR